MFTRGGNIDNSILYLIIWKKILFFYTKKSDNQTEHNDTY